MNPGIQEEEIQIEEKTLSIANEDLNPNTIIHHHKQSMKKIYTGCENYRANGE
jgi:hypothetical protein